MKRFAALAALVAVVVGVGVYFGARGESSPRDVPKAQQNSALERAKASGVIPGYRVVAAGSAYEVSGSQIRFRRVQVCNPESAGRCFTTRPLWYIEYRRPVGAQAQAIWRIAESQMPRATIKLFEVTPGLPNSHTPDARIMLIPKAGA
jgi:hypothetical protein